MEIHPFEGPVGADVTDVDLATIGDDDFERLYEAWLDRGVLRIRGQQSLDDAGLERFSARFGPLEEIPCDLIRLGSAELVAVLEPVTRLELELQVQGLVELGWGVQQWVALALVETSQVCQLQ